LFAKSCFLNRARVLYAVARLRSHRQAPCLYALCSTSTTPRCLARIRSLVRSLFLRHAIAEHVGLVVASLCSRIALAASLCRMLHVVRAPWNVHVRTCTHNRHQHDTLLIRTSNVRSVAAVPCRTHFASTFDGCIRDVQTEHICRCILVDSAICERPTSFLPSDCRIDERSGGTLPKYRRLVPLAPCHG
jgi:hypothetical protein